MTRAEFFNQADRHFFFKDPFEVAKYVLVNCKEEAEHVLSVADDVVNRRFKFDLRWDMERTYSHVIFENEIDWLYQPGDDPEWIFAFNRMRFWICLGQAYAMTGDEKYARTFAKQLCHWIAAVRREDPRNEKAWRSIEVGLRLEYWQKAMRYFEASPAVDDAVITAFVESVTEHAEFIMGIWNSYNLMSNWGVMANHGLFIAGVMLPQTARAKEYVAEALRRLELEMQIQVYRDGMQWEQSPMYHNEVAHCYLDVVLLAKRNGITLPESILRKTHAMCMFDLYAAKPDHNEISMGDSDEIDQRDIISKGAYLFGDSILKGRGYVLPDFDTAWDIGEAGLSEYAAMSAETPASTDKAFCDSGNFYFRSGWGTDDTFVHFHCGPLGAGHGHADKLHVDLFSRGEDILIDAGRHSYVFGEGRVPYKELDAHNTIRVNRRDIYVCKDSWACHDLSRPVNQKYYSDERYGYAEGGHLAYMKPEGVFVNRRVIYLKPDILVIADEFYGVDVYPANQFFHFNNAGRLWVEGSRYTYQSSRVRAELLLIAPELDSEVLETRISRHYNHHEKNQTVMSSLAGTSAYTVIALSDPDSKIALAVEKVSVRSNFKGIVFDDSQIEALNIRHGDRHYTLVIAHEEYASPTDTFFADGCTGFGSAVVFDRKKGENEIGTVLLW